ncbi:MAG: RnfABCDGE type electron transport complex subunit B [Treponema sp.]|jgi:Na+-translocating ferredoxin:NAD+ oxidoreductase RNF subunit RnfB|nr:RnfABCDGE type electron transport complex subunit B [Treponema sp.]
MIIIIITAAFAFVLALILGTALGFFSEFFAVPKDPLAERIREVLPGANCGACGFPGCDNYAAAVAAGNAGVNICSVGGAAVAEKIAEITGVNAGAVIQTVTVLSCQGSKNHVKFKGTYTGLATCRGAKLSAGGIKLCAWGCLGFGDCVKVCKFDALDMGKDGLPKVDYAKCTGCRICINECPQQILKSVPRDQKGAIPLCSNRNPVKAMVGRGCKIGCIKCGLCVKNCPQNCINLDSNIPVIDLSKCTSCGTCVEKCPTKALKILERDVFTAAG